MHNPCQVLTSLCGQVGLRVDRLADAASDWAQEAAGPTRVLAASTCAPWSRLRRPAH
ncbi:Hypothetical protein MSYG_3184 [Malassezia sympodialis ATCC 42132]|uniref:Uncharacterized protein n=1 Tax=Malassezia sympodialis (strain ATCC 42132) TaxID=1230383 RepID=A0A1M8A8N0_MALS4|nr:Hypothetical protein MSYG_3184 [Malassezia sympodialis ATCC 42132]